MAYTVTADLVFAAGGQPNLTDLADHDSDGSADAAVLTRAQEEADRWIDGYAYRLYSNNPGLPFVTVPGPIRDIAAQETIYRLKTYRNTVTADDLELRKQRVADLERLERGIWNPVAADPYPIGQGGGTPCAVETPEHRDAFKGFC